MLLLLQYIGRNFSERGLVGLGKEKRLLFRCKYIVFHPVYNLELLNLLRYKINAEKLNFYALEESMEREIQWRMRRHSCRKFWENSSDS